jgi:hypothetical protein
MEFFASNQVEVFEISFRKLFDLIARKTFQILKTNRGKPSVRV